MRRAMLGLLAGLLGTMLVPGFRSLARADGEPAPMPPSPGGEVDEATLLWDLCRYLRLSRTQAGHLLPLARQVDRAREALAVDEAAAQRTLEMLRDRPEEAGVIRERLQARRARLEEEVVRAAAPQLVRILTREQIALAWRLQGGSPPAYAEASPALTDPRAGFSQARRPTLMLGERELIFEVEALASRLRVPGGPLPAEPVLGRRRVEAAPGRASRPFPQVVVESDDPRDLMPALDLLIRRAFMSDGWVPVLEKAWARGLGVRPSRNFRLITRTPDRVVRDYRMERGLRDQTGRGPELEELGGIIDHGLYLFGPGQGLRLADAGVRDEYQVELSFRFLGGQDYQKLVDFKNGKKDGGLYTYQGQVTFYTLAVGGTPIPGKEHRLRLERDRETRIVRCYLDLRPIFAFIDLDDEAVFDDRVGLFFVDDVTTKNEQGPGALRWVSIRGPAPSP